MKQFLQSARVLVGMGLFVFSLFLSFDGFPLALLSWFGGGIVMLGYTVAISTMTHEDTGGGKVKALNRIVIISIAFAVASLGAAMVTWGGLVSVTMFDNITISFRSAGAVIGIVCGLFNIDRTSNVAGMVNKED